jgi:hypothetical protein
MQQARQVVISCRTTTTPTTFRCSQWHRAIVSSHARLQSRRRYASAAALDVILQEQESPARHETKPKRMRWTASGSHDQSSDADMTSNWSFEEWEIQSDIHNKQRDKRLFVNQDKHRNNMALWLALIRHHERRSGTQGIMRIWLGMQERQITLPAQGWIVAELWQTVIEAAIVEDKLGKVLEDAREMHQRSGRTDDADCQLTTV